MGYLNRVTLMGNLGADPETKRMEGDRVRTMFRMATTATWGQGNERQEKTTWHRIVCWGKVAELAERTLRKGAPVLVEGSLENRTWTNKEGIEQTLSEIRVTNLQLIGRRGEGEQRSQERLETYAQPHQAQPVYRQEQPQQPQHSQQRRDPFELEEEVPF